jgi:gliding motility-associated-like protein
MIRKQTCLLYLFFLAGMLGHSVAAYSQWKIDTVITRARCPAEGGTGGAISLTVSGMPGTYTYDWSNGGNTSQITNLTPGVYQVTIDNGSGQDTSVIYPVLQYRCDPGPARVFTPNGDLINDTWGIINAEYYPNLLVSVFNKWGQKVYEHKGEYVPWDGRNIFGLIVDSGVYYYIIYKDGGDLGDGIVTGSVSIIR